MMPKINAAEDLSLESKRQWTEWALEVQAAFARFSLTVPNGLIRLVLDWSKWRMLK